MKSRKRAFVFLVAIAMVLAAMGLPQVSAASVPEPIVTENAALNKPVEFRSFDDFTPVEMYDYWVDRTGLNGTGCRPLTGNHMTDGVLSWGATDGSQTNATMGMAFADANTNPNLGNMAWAFVDLGSSMIVSEVGIYAISSWVVNKLVIQLSNDAENWTTVFSGAHGPLKASDGSVVYGGGLVNTADYTRYFWDLTSHSLSSMSLSSPDADGGYHFAFTPQQARYVRTTNLISEHTSSGSSNNTVFAEIQVSAVKSGVAAPIASHASGSYASLPEITLTALQDDAEIRYTTDGSYPTPESTLYTGPISTEGLGGSFAVRAIAVTDRGISSPADYRYVIARAGNLALHRDVEFRSFDDFSQCVDMYDYYVDYAGIDGTGCRALTGNHLTDGDTGWNGADGNRMNACLGSAAASNTNLNLGNMAWALIDLGELITIDRVGLYAVSSWFLNKPVVQVSADGQSWTTVFSGTSKLYNSNGDVIYSDGYVNIQPYMSSLHDYTYHQIDSYSLTNPTHNGGWILSFDGVEARYVRATGLYSTHINGGTSNNTAFSEIEVYAVESTLPELEQAVAAYAPVSVEDSVLRWNTPLEAALALLPETVELTDILGAQHSAGVVWSCSDYASVQSAGGKATFVPTVTLPAGIVDVYGVSLPAVAFTVLEKADFALLNGLIREAKSLNESDWLSGWPELQAALAAAEALPENALQAEADSACARLQAAIGALEAAGEPAALRALLEEYAELQSERYTASSFVRFAEERTSAEALISAPATQSALDAAHRALESAYAGLVLRGDLSAVEEQLAACADIALERYTLTSAGLLEEAAFDARRYLFETAPEEAAAADVQRHASAVAAALEALTLLGDKSQLETRLSACEPLLSGDLTAASLTALQSAFDAANKIFSSLDADQAAVDSAVAQLNSAMEAAVELSTLRAAYTAAQALDAAHYTELSFSLLEPALIRAATVLADGSATWEQVSAAETALSTATGGLILRGDKSALRALVLECQELKQSGRPNGAWQSFQETLAYARAVAEQDAGQPQIDAALLALEQAREQLPEPSAEESNCGSAAGLPLALLALALTAAAARRR